MSRDTSAKMLCRSWGRNRETAYLLTLAVLLGSAQPWTATTALAATRAADSIEEILVAVREAIRQDDYQEADQLVRRAIALARAAGDEIRQTELVARRKRIDRLQTSYQELNDERRLLEREANDPRANREVGLFYCIEKGQWKQGLPLLARSDEPKLKRAAQTDLSAPEAAEDRFVLGELWMAAAEIQRDRTKRGLQVRARHWYVRAYPGLPAERQRKIRDRLTSMEFSLDKIVLWNVHNGVTMNRGTLVCRLTLLQNGKPVFREVLPLRWSRTEQSRTVVWPPPNKTVDAVRVEVLKWYKRGSGLAEIEVLAQGENVARGAAAEASSMYDERFLAKHVTDGRKDNATEDKSGIWLPNARKPAWIGVDLTRLAE